MSDLTEARAELARQYRGYVPGEEADVEAAIDTLLSEYRSALVGETDAELTEEVARRIYMFTVSKGAHLEEQDDTTRDVWWYAAGEAVELAQAPLLVQLQDKNERIKALEAALEAHAGCLGDDQCPACRAIPEAP